MSLKTTEDESDYVINLEPSDRMNMRFEIIKRLDEIWGFDTTNASALFSSCAVEVYNNLHNKQAKLLYEAVFPNSCSKPDEWNTIKVSCVPLFRAVIAEYRRLHAHPGSVENEARYT